MKPNKLIAPRRPENEIPGWVQAKNMIARTEQLVLWLDHVEVYSCGVAFEVQARQRKPEEMLNMFGFGRLQMPASSPPLMVGIEDTAGMVATNLPGARGALHGGGGGGNALAASRSYWLSQLPAPGPLTIIVAWPHFGLSETRFEIDGDALAQAATQVEVLWPEADTTIYPDPTTGEPREPVLELPEGGWFESAKAKQPPPPPPPQLPPGYTRINYAYDPKSPLD